MTGNEILAWLTEEDPARLEELWRLADDCRRANVGDAVHLRGLLEVSNNCVRQCGYCGLRAGNRALERYRMTADEIRQCAREAVEFGYGTLVIQSGEDYGLPCEWVTDAIRWVKANTPLAVTLSLGERPDGDLVAWRQAGADRYLLRFETSNESLYERIHPSMPGRKSDRVAMLRRLKELGYQAGSGAMVGIPGQTYDDLAGDVELFARLDLDMIGVGPYIPHPATPLGATTGMAAQPGAAVPHETARGTSGGMAVAQAPNTELMTYKMIALTRLACPWANIPSTTALATLNRESGRELGLMRGANIVMPNLTPVKYRRMYEIYPDKACIQETARDCSGCLRMRIAAIGRSVGVGPGEAVRRS